jgi:thiamine-monophosphate kinase
VSDIAAMGAVPAWFTLSLSLPKPDAAWLEQFAAGMFDLADAYDMELVGGDTVKGPLVITIQIFGLVETDRWLTRSGGKPGDLVFVSGVPGEAAMGLALIQHKLHSPDITSSAALQRQFLRPQPRVALGRCLRAHASAAQDISDGLLTDLSKLCAASNCGAHIDIEALPRSPAMNALLASGAQESYILGGGDDYELVFTVPPERALQVEAAIATEVRCTPIGRLVEHKQVKCFRAGVEVQPSAPGFDHFG